MMDDIYIRMPSINFQYQYVKEFIMESPIRYREIKYCLIIEIAFTEKFQG